MDSIKIKMDKFKALSSNKVFRLRKQIGQKYHKVVITDEANLSLVFHMYTSMTILVFDNMTMSAVASEIEKLIEKLKVIQENQRVIFIYACGYCTLLERHSSTAKTEACCKDCHFYVLNKSIQNVKELMLVVRKTVVLKMPKCYFLPVSLPSFSFDWHISSVKGTHQNCCPHLVEELSCFTQSVLSQMQKVLDSVVNNYNFYIDDICSDKNLPSIDWSKIYLTESQAFERQTIISKKVNALICDFIHTIYEEECQQELDHVKMALKKDFMVKQESAEKVNADEVDTSLDSPSQNNVKLNQNCAGDEISKDLEIEPPISLLSDFDHNLEVTENVHRKRKSANDQCLSRQNKRKKVRLDTNSQDTALNSSSMEKNVLFVGAIHSQKAEDESSILDTPQARSAVSTQESDALLSHSKKEKNKSAFTDTDFDVRTVTSENNYQENFPDLEVLEEEIQILGRRRKDSIQIIDDGRKSPSDVQVLCPVESNNAQVPNSKPVITKKKSLFSKPNSQHEKKCKPSHRNEELVVLDDACSESESQSVQNSRTSANDASCDSSDYVSCDENPDVFCEKISKSSKETLVSSPEVECVLPLQKQVVSSNDKSLKTCSKDREKCRLKNSIPTSLSTVRLLENPTSPQESSDDLPTIPSKNISHEQHFKKNVTNGITNLEAPVDESECKLLINEENSLRNVIKTENESEDEVPTQSKISVFKHTEKTGSTLRVFVTGERFEELNNVLAEENYSNYVHLSCHRGLVTHFIEPIIAAIRDTMSLKMNQNKHLLVGVCLGTADTISMLNGSNDVPCDFLSSQPSAVALKVKDSLSSLKSSILKAYPHAFVLFFRLPTISKEGNVKTATDGVNSFIHDLNHSDKRLAPCFASKCPIVSKLVMSQYVLSRKSVKSWFQVCKWYLEVLEGAAKKSAGVSVSGTSSKRKSVISKPISSDKSGKSVDKQKRQTYVNKHSNIVCVTPKTRSLNQVCEPSTSASKDLTCIEESESDVAVVYTDSESDTECSITHDDIAELVEQIESMLKETFLDSRSAPLDVNTTLLSVNVCTLIAVGRAAGDREEEDNLLRIARKLSEHERKNCSAPVSLEAKERKSIILSLGTVTEFLEEANLSQAANDLLHTSVFNLRKVYSG